MNAPSIFEHPAAEGRAYAALAVLDGGVFVHVTGVAELDAVELSRNNADTRQSFRIPVAIARALGVELLAAAAAVDAARGVAVQPVEG